jgi:hypothetical protein
MATGNKRLTEHVAYQTSVVAVSVLKRMAWHVREEAFFEDEQRGAYDG